MDSQLTFNVQGLNKDGAVALAKHLGLRRDWSRVRLAEIQSALKAFPAFKLRDAAISLPEYFDQEDIEALTDPDAEFDDGTDDDVTDVEVKQPEVKLDTAWNKPPQPPQPKQAIQGKAPDVSQVAALLAQLLATGKAGLDAGEVEQIVAPMLDRSEKVMMSAVNNMLTEAVKAIPAREIVIKTEHTAIKIDGLQHFKFEALLKSCSARNPDGNRLNIWLYGPPGTGKTTAASNAAKALGLPFYCTGALLSKYDIVGFIDANGKLVRSTFREAWEHGGVFLFDEIDGSAPQAIVAFNAALANGVMAFPDGMVKRHPDCVVIAAANTNGLGATADFVGRMKLDAASLDRYVFMSWPIDEHIEAALCAHKEWAKLVQRCRKAVADQGLKGIHITPRATMHGASLLDQGLDLDDVKQMVLRKGMTDDQWAALAI